jgi:hypothetical protein
MDNSLTELGKIKEDLQALRSKLESALTDVESRLSVLERNASEQPKKQLREYVAEILQNSNEPLTTKEIAELLEEVGYITKADRKNWPTMILHCLTNSPEFKRASRNRSRPVRYALVDE